MKFETSGSSSSADKGNEPLEKQVQYTRSGAVEKIPYFFDGAAGTVEGLQKSEVHDCFVSEIERLCHGQTGQEAEPYYLYGGATVIAMADHGEENTVLTLMLRGVDLDRPQRQQPRLGQPQIDSGVVEVFIAQVTPHSPPVIDRSTFKPKITTAETYSERQSLQELAEAHRPFSTDELVVVVDRLREIECFGSPEAFYQATQEMVGDNPQATFQLGNSEVQVISFTNKRGEQYAQVSVLQSREASRQVNEVFNRRQPENLRVFEYILHENTLVVREGEGRPNKMEYQERAYNSADDRVLWPVLRRIQNPGPEDRQISPDGKG